ncbi:MAG: sigma-54 interaction domain-containing protein [Planctomycetaceae bacterium]
MELDFRKAPQLLENIVDEMAVGLFTVDADGRFVSWNGGAERITGYLSDAVVGQPCHILEGPHCKGFGTLAELLRTDVSPPGGLCNQECKILSRDGREIFIHGNVRLLFDPNSRIVGAVGSFTDVTSLVQANERIAFLEEQTRELSGFERLGGRSPAMREVFRRLQLAADSDVTVFLSGESGTGKELAARAIHSHSTRRDKPFVAVNCSAIPETLLESELFGHVKGAFTGAVKDKTGLFAAAEGGSLFLDEIGDVSPLLQLKLLRVLQEREIQPVGDERLRNVNVRLITATNKDLKQLVSAGEFREDFYYRIHVFEIRLPPLRERREDGPLLVESFIEELAVTYGKSVSGIARDAMQCLMQAPWPGNVRELRNAIEHAFVTVNGTTISLLDLPDEVRSSDKLHVSHAAASTSQRDSRPAPLENLTQQQQLERDRIVKALEETGGNKTAAAQRLGTSRVTLWKKVRRYGIESG